MAENILELRGLSKSFGTNQVLFDVNFSLKPGEVHAIIGENGAGKSTMMNITYGLVKPNSGEIYIDGKKVDIKDPNDAEKNGICFVHQEIALCQEMTIAQNILMTRVKNMKDISLNYKKINEEAQKLIAEDAPMAFLYMNSFTVAMRDNVKGYTVHPTAVTTFLKDVYFE